MTYPLPVPVSLTTDFPSPAGPLNQLERVDGMRVTVANFAVTAPTGGFTNEKEATGSSKLHFTVQARTSARGFDGNPANDPDRHSVVLTGSWK